MRIVLLGMAIAAALLCVFPAAAAEEKKSPSEQEFCRLDRNNDREITAEEFSSCEFHKLEHVKVLPYADPELSGQNKGRRLSDDELKAYLFNKADKSKNRVVVGQGAFLVADPDQDAARIVEPHLEVPMDRSRQRHPGRSLSLSRGSSAVWINRTWMLRRP